MSKPRRRWLDYLSYLALRWTACVFDMFPIEWNLRTARLIGWCWFHVPAWLPVVGRLGRHRDRAMQHLRLAYGDAFDEVVHRRVALRSMQHFAMLAVEVLLTPRLLTRWTWRRYVRLVDLEPALRLLLDRRGCIMLTPHFGSFELLGYALAMVGFPITAIMRPFDNDYLNGDLLDRRVRSGLELLYKKGAAQRAQEVLREGRALCFIADQDAGRKGIFVDFFGQKASTYKSIGLLAMEENVPIIVGAARRVWPHFRYEIFVQRIIQPADWRDRDDELRWITQEFSTAMEQMIRTAPEQYLWIHRRWKSRPREQRRRAHAPVQAVASASQ
ncbi:MAG: lysophospholipid acyltransferase family protein [Phycisphaerae bacterium]